MADHPKLPHTQSEEPNAPTPPGPSDQNLERWANSRGLQPPKLPDQRGELRELVVRMPIALC